MHGPKLGPGGVVGGETDKNSDIHSSGSSMKPHATEMKVFISCLWFVFLAGPSNGDSEVSVLRGTI
jgi:hypothetical protein